MIILCVVSRSRNYALSVEGEREVYESPGASRAEIARGQMSECIIDGTAVRYIARITRRLMPMKF